jgi:chromosome segregation ATPase
VLNGETTMREVLQDAARAQIDDNLKEAREDIQTWRERAEAAQAKATELASVTAKLRDDREAVRRDLEDARNDIQTWRERAAAAQAKATEFRRDLEAARGDLGNARRSLAKARQERGMWKERAQIPTRTRVKQAILRRLRAVLRTPVKLTRTGGVLPTGLGRLRNVKRR